MYGLSFDDMNSWRVEATQKLKAEANNTGKKIEIINPVMYYNFTERKHQSEIEVEEFDLAHVISSNIIIVNLHGLYSSIGTIIEIHDAHYHHKIPVIAFGDEEIYNNLHPWIQNSITRVENNIDDVVEYISDFYFN